MTIGRRSFLGASLAAGVALSQEGAAPRAAAAPVPTRKGKVVKLFKSPDIHPNAMETAADGLWIADQVSEKVHKLDWETGKVLLEIQTEAHNTSGLAIGGGYMWINSNGGVSGRRPPRPTDKPFGEILQADMKTGKTIKAFRPPWQGGVHGNVWVEETQTLWSTALNVNALVELDPKDNLRIKRIIPVKGDRPHGLDWENGFIWCLFAGDRKIQKLDPNSGKIVEQIELSKESDPDPHGLCLRNGKLYYCDAGLTAPGPATAAGYICRIDL